LFHRHREAGGFECKLNHQLKTLVEPLPKYIPTFYHAFPCAHPLDLDWVAIPLYRLFKQRRDGTFRLSLTDGETLRRSLSLRPYVKILITGPSYDQPLEDFWRYHQQTGLLESLAALNIQGLTAPNFSFFSDAPLLHNRYNRSRILRVSERISAVGIPTILHLNALHEQEWRDWETLLRDDPGIRHVCLEWQTGYSSPALGDKAFDRLVELQSNVGRPLHPIFIGGGRYSEKLFANFASQTVIDADPFMNTVHRKVFSEQLGGITKWKFRRSAKEEPLDARFQFNFEKHSRRILDRLSGTKPSIQTEFGFTQKSKSSFTRPKQETLSNFRLTNYDNRPPAGTRIQ
jgi:hypothetical protein